MLRRHIGGPKRLGQIRNLGFRALVMHLWRRIESNSVDQTERYRSSDQELLTKVLINDVALPSFPS